MIVIFVEFIDQLINYPINHASPTAHTVFTLSIQTERAEETW